MNNTIQKIAALCISICFLASYMSTYAQDKPLAKWTIIVYMAADNNLYPFALQNIQDMAKGIVADSNAVNILVQLDKPEDNKTWRYKITQQGAIEDESVSTEMGIEPVKELIDCAKWAHNKYKVQLINHIQTHFLHNNQPGSISSKKTDIKQQGARFAMPYFLN